MTDNDKKVLEINLRNAMNRYQKAKAPEGMEEIVEMTGNVLVLLSLDELVSTAISWFDNASRTYEEK